MQRPVCKVLRWVVLLLLTVPLFAVRVKDGGSSSNGVGPDSLCPDSTATPFFAPLDGTQSPPAGCTKGNGDPNQPNPPSPYPNRVVVLNGSGFTVTITPALWSDGEFTDGTSKHTLLQVTFSGQAGMTLRSLVIGSQLSNPAYVLCDPNFPDALPDCVSSPILNPNSVPSALEPAPIALADTTMTRWDFNQFTPGNSLTLLVDGFPSEFSGIDIFPNSNSLAQTSFSNSNFVAVVKDASNNTLAAGGLPLNAAPAAKNDLFANATVITGTPFTDFVDTSATEPQEVLTGSGAGGETNPQQDPIPQDPNPANAGTPCAVSWPSGSNRVFRSVWYTFTATASGAVTISTDGSRYDTGIYVFTGSTTSPTPVACNDDGVNSSGFTIQSSDVTFNASSGQTYNIMVSEVPPLVGVDANNNSVADPLANDATLKFKLTGNGVIGPPANPVPYVDILNPVSATIGASLAQLKISGAGFVSGATVGFNGNDLTPSTVTSSQIVVDNVTVPAGVAMIPVTVTNPNSIPNVGTSNIVPFPVNKQTTAVRFGRSDLTSGGGYSPIAIDLNGDGWLDIVSATMGSNAVSVSMGSGKGKFQTPHLYPTGTQPMAVATGDFNGDGRVDLAVANEGGGSGGNVSVLLGNGDGSFQTHVDYAAGSKPDGVVAADFNGDGTLDLAVANFGSSNVSILLGNGDGSFQSHVDYGVGSQPMSVATGDFNGDGKLDLVLVGGSLVSILLGNGDGTFQTATTYTGSSPIWVTTGDFNRDGKLDVATANGKSNSISVFRGNGDGTLQPRKDYATPAYAYSLATGDMNGGGKLDLVAGTTTSTMAIFFGNGDGTFQNASTYTTGVSNGALALGDLNNDGRFDVAASLSTGISIMLQVPTAILSKTSLSFGAQLINTTSAAQIVTLTNKGTALLTLSSISVSGHFKQTNTCGSGLEPGASCSVSVTFTPSLAGSTSGTVTIKDNATSVTQTIALTGIGTVVQLSPTSLSFGAVSVGTKTAAKTVKLTNKGATSLSISSISISGTNPGDFSQTNNCGTAVAAGASCTISVSFKPTAKGARTASVSVSDNGGGSPQKVPLSGSGV